MSTESAGDDDNFGTESSQHAILRVLGPERRNRVLAGLYMGRLAEVLKCSSLKSVTDFCGSMSI